MRAVEAGGLLVIPPLTGAALGYGAWEGAEWQARRLDSEADCLEKSQTNSLAVEENTACKQVITEARTLAPGGQTFSQEDLTPKITEIRHASSEVRAHRFDYAEVGFAAGTILPSAILLGALGIRWLLGSGREALANRLELEGGAADAA